MSSSISDIETHSPEAKSLKSSFSIMMQDLQALPAEAFDKSFGPKVRTVADIMHEINTVNDDILRSINSEACMEWPEGWITAPEGLRSAEAVKEAFAASANTILAKVAPLSSEEMSGKVTTEHGETTIAERCRFMTLHNWYHSGQLNFIQTLLGDDAWHWS